MIQDLAHDSVSLHMRAGPDDVYALVADVTRTPDFSPEILECTWLDGATEPAVGARFKARNKVANRPAWRWPTSPRRYSPREPTPATSVASGVILVSSMAWRSSSAATTCARARRSTPCKSPSF